MTVSNSDYARRKWFDPTSADRFRGTPLAMAKGNSAEELLTDITNLLDRLFDNLAVLDQFDEVGSRGAQTSVGAPPEVDEISCLLAAAREELLSAYTVSSEARTRFVDRQLAERGLGGSPSGLRLHLGSGGHLLDGWVNIDAGGDDLAANVNWGLPFPDESATYVYAAHILEHLRFRDHAPVFIRDIWRVLAPGGTVRLVVPDVHGLLEAYVIRNAAYFEARQRHYPLLDGFLNDGIATLDYILLFCGADSQTFNFNHKFGYDATTLKRLLEGAGFANVETSAYQESKHEALRVDEYGYNASTATADGHHFSLFMEATK